MVWFLTSTKGWCKEGLLPVGGAVGECGNLKDGTPLEKVGQQSVPERVH